MRLEGKVAVITGGASGLGAASATMLVAKGAKVAIWDMDTAKGESFAKQLGANAYFVQCDVTNPSAIDAALAATVQRFGAVHILIASAGVFKAEATVRKAGPHSIATFHRTMQINVLGSFIAARAVVGQLAKQEKEGEERGVIILVSSIAGTDGIRGQLAYGASKGMIDGMTLPMARDLSQLGIRVMTIAPGPIRTAIMEGNRVQTNKTIEAAILVGREGRGEEFAMMIAAIIENGFLNGTVIRLDGGLRIPHL